MLDWEKSLSECMSYHYCVGGILTNSPLASPVVSVLHVGYPSVSFKFNLSNFRHSQSLDGTDILLVDWCLVPAKGLPSCEEAELSN